MSKYPDIKFGRIYTRKGAKYKNVYIIPLLLHTTNLGEVFVMCNFVGDDKFENNYVEIKAFSKYWRIVE